QRQIHAAQLAEAGGEVHHRPLVLELQGPEGHPLWDGTGQVTGLRAGDQPLHHRLRPLLQGGVLRQAQIRGLRTNGVAAAGLLRQVVDQIAAGSLLVLGDEAAGGQKQQRRQQRDQPLSSHGPSSSPSRQGSVTINRVPPPGAPSARTTPPRRLTVSLTMLSPKPVPPAARDRALSTR